MSQLEEAVIVQTKEQSVLLEDIYWELCVCACICECVCLDFEAKRLLDNVKWRWRSGGCGPAAPAHISCGRLAVKEHWPWWILTSVTFECRQDLITRTMVNLFIYLFIYCLIVLFIWYYFTVNREVARCPRPEMKAKKRRWWRLSEQNWGSTKEERALLFTIRTQRPSCLNALSSRASLQSWCYKENTRNLQVSEQSWINDWISCRWDVMFGFIITLYSRRRPDRFQIVSVFRVVCGWLQAFVHPSFLSHKICNPSSHVILLYKCIVIFNKLEHYWKVHKFIYFRKSITNWNKWHRLIIT